MNIEEQLKRYRENQNIIPDEQHIKETVRKSIESYCSVEQEKQLTYWEFFMDRVTSYTQAVVAAANAFVMDCCNPFAISFRQ